MRQVEYGWMMIDSGQLSFCDKFPKMYPNTWLTDAFDELGQLGWIMCGIEHYPQQGSALYRFYRKIKKDKK